MLKNGYYQSTFGAPVRERSRDSLPSIYEVYGTISAAHLLG
jgi:hypothetical protein